MIKRYETILFDLDGTLTDSKIGITKSVQFSLKSFGIIENDLNDLEKFIGPPLMESFKLFYNFDESEAKKAVEKYREYFNEQGIYENSIYPGIFEMLGKLYSKGKKIILASSKPAVYVKRILEHFEIAEFFSMVVGSNLDGSMANKGEIISFIINEKGFNKLDKIVMVGDRKHDIIGANETGIDSIGVLYGYGSKEELLSYKPTHLAESVLQLEQILL